MFVNRLFQFVPSIRAITRASTRAEERSLRCRVCGERVCKLSELRKKQLGGKIELALTSDNPNPYLRARVRNLAFKPVGMSLNLTMM